MKYAEKIRTCRNISDRGENLSGDHWLFDFVCSECGTGLCADEFGHSPLLLDDESIQISYCPNCGARVIEEGVR